MFLLGAVRLKCGLAVNHFRPCWNSVAASLEKVCGRGAPTTHLLRLACDLQGSCKREEKELALLIPSAAEARGRSKSDAKVSYVIDVAKSFHDVFSSDKYDNIQYFRVSKIFFANIVYIYTILNSVSHEGLETFFFLYIVRSVR